MGCWSCCAACPPRRPASRAQVPWWQALQLCHAHRQTLQQARVVHTLRLYQAYRQPWVLPRVVLPRVVLPRVVLPRVVLPRVVLPRVVLPRVAPPFVLPHFQRHLLLLALPHPPL